MRALAGSRWRLRRNHDCCLFGASWAHQPGWSPRLFHIYLGPLLLTISVSS